MTAAPRTILVTGGAGFIGSAVVRRLVGAGGHRVVNLDALTYASNLASLVPVQDHKNYAFEQADIRDEAALRRVFAAHRPDAIMHLAAESHVDRSIDGPAAFMETNVMGTFALLGVALDHWRGLGSDAQAAFRFHHVSTDEVFGDLPFGEGAFTENTQYAPSSPYAASKAASDHLARAWGRTYGLPVVISNSSNNYGPFQFPEKLIPLLILNAIEEKPLPIYGDGANVRDWLHVEDHASALEGVLTRGEVGESYLVGGRAERSNLEVARAICRALDELRPRASGAPHEELIAFVADRPGHDRRYAIDPRKAAQELDWRPTRSFETGIADTVAWYLENDWWWRPLRDARYSGERLGLAGKTG